MFGLDGLVNGIFGFLGQEQTNDANAQNALMTNAFNASQADVNRGFLSDQAGITRGFNAEEAAKSREFNSAEAARNREFQNWESSTSWWRGVQDMKAAGLNPMLAFSQGGASSPSGSSASSSPASSSNPGGSQASGVMPSYTSPIMGAISSASALAQVARTDAETDNIKADTLLKGAQSGERRSADMLNVWQQNKIIAELNDKLPYEIGRLVSEIVRNTKDVDLIDRRIANLKTDQELTAAEVFLAKMQFHKALNNSGAADTTWGRNVAPFLHDAGQITNSAADVARAYRGGRGLRY